MVARLCMGLYFLLLGLSAVLHFQVPGLLMAVLALIAGIALLLGL